MISLLYTGAIIANQQQSRGTASIGGYISTTPVPNGRLNSLFSDISYYQQQTTECKLIAISNQGVAINSVRIWIENNDPLLSYQIALINPAADSCGALCFEKLSRSSDIPLYGTFLFANSEAGCVTIPSIAASQVVGVWIKRIYNRNTTQAIENRSCARLSTSNIDNSVNSIEQSFNIVIDFI